MLKMERKSGAKMWKYISRVSKLVDEKKNNKAKKPTCDKREYEKTKRLDRVNIWVNKNWSRANAF